MAREIRAVSPSGTLYARIMNRTGLWWNGSAFEAYDASNYADYDVAMTEQGSSNVYVADFPSAITTSGTYEYFVHRQAGASPAEGDVVISTGTVDWTGSDSGASDVNGGTGSMTGSEWRAYVLRLGFKRTDKDTELYEATTDAVQEMRRRFMFDEAKTETTTTDTISTLGDFKINLETDFGLLLGVVLEDDDTGTTLERVSKAEFDKLYPSINVDDDRGYPKHYCVYAGQIYIGPAPDSVDYVYRLSYSKKAGTVTSDTSAVPFTSLYRDVLAQNVLMRLYEGLEEYDKADRHEVKFERKFLEATRRETVNSGEHCFTQRYRDC